MRARVQFFSYKTMNEISEDHWSTCLLKKGNFLTSCALKSQSKWHHFGTTPLAGEEKKEREEGSGWGIHVYLWRIHFDIRQN